MNTKWLTIVALSCGALGFAHVSWPQSFTGPFYTFLALFCFGVAHEHARLVGRIQALEESMQATQRPAAVQQTDVPKTAHG